MHEFSETIKTEKLHKKGRLWFFIKKRLLIAIIIIIVVAVLIFVTWFLQQQKINELSKQKVSLTSSQAQTKKQLDLQTSSNAQLKKQIDDLNQNINSLKSPEQAKITLVVNKAQHEPIPANVTYFNRTQDFIYVDITITNSSDVSKNLTGYFSQSALSLKDDSTDTKYPLCRDSPDAYRCNTGLYLPAGQTELLSQSVPPGEKVRGIVAFYVPVNLKTATMSYNEVKYTLTIQDAVQE